MGMLVMMFVVVLMGMLVMMFVVVLMIVMMLVVMIVRMAAYRADHFRQQLLFERFSGFHCFQNFLSFKF